MLSKLIQRPIAVLLSFLALVILGLLASAQLPLSLLPEVGIPRLSVQLSYPNMPARSLENTVVAPLRNILLQVNGLADIRSRCRDEQAVIYLDFPFGTSPNLAFIEVNEKIDQAMNSLPRDLMRPRVVASDLSDIPVVQLAITLANPSSEKPEAELLELSALAEKIFRRRLEQLAEIAFADLSGQLSPQILVRPNRPLLQSLGISEAELAQSLQAANIDMGGMLLRDGHYEYNVRLSANLQTADDLKKLSLRAGGRILSLGELADIQLVARPPRGYFMHNGQPGLVFTIRKRADARLFDLQDKLEALLGDLQQAYPHLRFSLDNDQSGVLRASVDNLSSGLLYGAAGAILILFAFFREWRRPLLIGLAVPVALVLTLLGFYIFGLSINVISLAGLILGVGLMIDNSIIVLDNMQQVRATGVAAPEAACQGANEVIRPLIASALTTMAVFLPLVLLSGIAGALFKDQALAVSLALFASLLTAYFLLPLLMRKAPAVAIRTVLSPAWQWFEGSVDRFLHFRWLVLLLSLIALLGAYGLYRQLPREGFPKLSRSDFELAIDWNSNISLAENTRRSQAISQDFKQRFGGNTAAFIGEQQFMLSDENQAINASTLAFYREQSSSSLAFAKDFIAFWQQQYPSAIFSFRPLPNLFDRLFLQDDTAIELRISDASARATPPWEKIIPLIQSLSAAGLATEAPARQEVMAIQLQYENLQTYGVSPDALRQRLLTSFNENEITRLRSGDRSLAVLLGDQEALSLEKLLQTPILNTSGQALPLRYFIQTQVEEDYKVLTADRSGEYLRLAFPPGIGPQQIGQIQQIAATAKGLNYQMAGQYFTDQSRLQELLWVLLLSFALLYLILAAQFEKLGLPLLVLFVVPLSLSGSLVALWLVGESINLVSLIGMVVTGGIVVNDAILKVEMIEKGIAQGLDQNTAIHLAARRRLRAIFMTSLTTILALLPVLFSSGLGAELQAPLALSVIGGLVVGTFASLYVIPPLYRLLAG